ncbi:MAG: hypothetical protein ACKPJD_25870, partial [Planctomycetaceae bacterium]
MLNYGGREPDWLPIAASQKPTLRSRVGKFTAKGTAGGGGVKRPEKSVSRKAAATMGSHTMHP